MMMMVVLDLELEVRTVRRESLLRQRRRTRAIPSVLVRRSSRLLRRSNRGVCTTSFGRWRNRKGALVREVHGIVALSIRRRPLAVTVALEVVSIAFELVGAPIVSRAAFERRVPILKRIRARD